jgi:DNA repair protein RadC
MSMRYQFATVELRRTGPVKTTDDVIGMCEKEGMFAASQEVFWIVTYGAETELRSVIEIARGNYYQVAVSIPIILSALAAAGTDRFWLMHNHPSGNVEPTKQDVTLSKRIMAVANLADAYLEDHIIIGPPARIYSMKDHGQLTPREVTAVYAAQTPIVVVHKEPA